MNLRNECDLLGDCNIPGDVYWGIHTYRAIQNFQISNQLVPRELIRAIAIVKKSCCDANKDLGYITSNMADKIMIACDEIIAGKLNDQFPVDAMQGGAGTSTNMNVNEVIANRALELMGHCKGEYGYCHPLENVNLHQSTNDVYPTALKVACIESVRKLSEAIALLQGSLQQKEKAWSSVVTIGRTEMQDAVPITLGAQFASFADAISRDRWRTFKCEERLRVINLGGTAVGTGLTAPRRYIFLVVEKLRQITGYGLMRGENVMDQTANADVFVEVSGMLSAHAANIVKICNDMRQLHFVKEIELPGVQAGSSIMPGKVNPVILESAISVGLKVMANHGLIADCASRGSLQINEFLPLIANTLLESISILISTNTMLTSHVNAIAVNTNNCSSHAFNSLVLITAFLPNIGYKRAEVLVKEYAETEGIDFHKFLKNKLGEELVERVLSPAALMSLGFKDIKDK